MIQQDYFLKKYGITFDATDSVEERLRRMTRAFGVYESYEGDAPYIFISYAHLDSALVLPAIKAIQEKGYPVWYDAGISPGSEWAADISRHLKNASLVIAFVSENAFESNNCRAEIVYAFGNKKPMLTVQLDQSPLPDGLDMQLGLSQMFKAFAYDDGDLCMEQLTKASILLEKIRPVLKEQREAQRQEQQRLRRQAEETQQRCWEAEQDTKDNERKQQDQARREKKEAEKQAKEEAHAKRTVDDQVKKVNEAYLQVEFALGKGGHELAYKTAISFFNEKVCPHEAVSPETKARVAFLRDKFYNRLYRDACELEADKETRQLAAKVFGALPVGYKDAVARKQAIEKQENAKLITASILLPVLYLAMNVCVARYTLHLVDFWLWQFLLLLAPAVLTFVLALGAGKTLQCRLDYVYMILLALTIILTIADPFLIQQLKVWVRIVYTLIAGLLSAFAMFMGVGMTADWVDSSQIPQVKLPS